jgi:hypothetical protein
MSMTMEQPQSTPAARPRETLAALVQHANGVFGGKQSEGAYSGKDASDLLELATNTMFKSQPDRFGPCVTAERAMTVLADLDSIMACLPSQTRRDEEQESLQQFSTPPPLAWLAAWVANLSANDVVLEPSAGVGGLVCFAKLAGCRVIANELSERRSKLLAFLNPDEQFAENAEQINNVLPSRIKPSVVLMNPPFSTAGQRMGDRSVRNGWIRHVDQALARLDIGGRLVAILPAGRQGGTPVGMRGWLNLCRCSVLANVGFGRKVYVNMGTNFPVRLLVIDKMARRTDPVVGEVEEVADAVKLLNCVRESRNESHDAVAGAPTRANDEPSCRRGGAAVSRPGHQGIDSLHVTGAVLSRQGDAVGGVVAEQSTASLTIHTAATAPSVPLTDAVFEPYRPQRLLIDGARPHPTPLVQSSAMASVLPPEPTFAPALPFELVESGKLSDAQLEAVVYAGQAHREWLPDVLVDEKPVRYRKGFFIGDATGCIAAGTMIYDPVANTSTAVEVLEQRGEWHRVLSLTDRGLRTHWADAPYVKGKADLYRVTCESGRRVVVTRQHRFLGKRFNDDWRRLDDGLGVCDAIAAIPQELGDELVWDKIISIDFVRHDTFYDFHVPGPENYVANGLIHNNSGKGREICGIIMDSFARGCRRAIWVSKNTKLIRDAIRDWTDLGGDEEEIVSLADVKRGESIPRSERNQILFCTYATLRSGSAPRIRDPLTKKVRQTDLPGDYPRYFAKDIVRLCNKPSRYTFEYVHENCVIRSGPFKGHDLMAACDKINPEMDRLSPDAATIREAFGLPVRAAAPVKVDDDANRLKQVTDWAGPAFDGVIALDEAHYLRASLAI